MKMSQNKEAMRELLENAWQQMLAASLVEEFKIERKRAILPGRVGGAQQLSAPSSNRKEGNIFIKQSVENTAFLNEVTRVLYSGQSREFPITNTQQYFDAAQEYAIYGAHFFDFPQDPNAILRQGAFRKESMIQHRLQSLESKDMIVRHTESKNMAHGFELKFRENYNNPEKFGDFFPGCFNKSPNQITHNSLVPVTKSTPVIPQLSFRPITFVNSRTRTAALIAFDSGHMLLSNRVTYLGHSTHNLPPEQATIKDRYHCPTSSVSEYQDLINKKKTTP